MKILILIIAIVVSSNAGFFDIEPRVISKYVKYSPEVYCDVETNVEYLIKMSSAGGIYQSDIIQMEQ